MCLRYVVVMGRLKSISGGSGGPLRRVAEARSDGGRLKGGSAGGVAAGAAGAGEAAGAGAAGEGDRGRR